MSAYKNNRLEEIVFNDLKKPNMPLVIDDWTLAFRLGFTGKALWFFIRNRAKLYKIFKIKKATGGLRTIHNPDKRIRILHKQIRVKFLMKLCNELGSHVSAYQAGKSTRDAAIQHISQCDTCAKYDLHTCKIVLEASENKYKFNKLSNANCLACSPIPKHDCSRKGVKIHLDLKDFFGSTRRSWIRQYFQTVIGYNFYVSSLLATLLTVEFEGIKNNKRTKWNGVPQGAPASGDICNLIADWRLDQPLLKAIEGTRWVYTRYADDLYLSHPENLSKEKVNSFLKILDKVVAKSGYRLNNKKKHIQRPHRRQKLLGMVLNQKVSIPRDTYRNFKALLHNCALHGFESQLAKSGYESVPKLKQWIVGVISYYKNIDIQKAERLDLVYKFALSKS